MEVPLEGCVFITYPSTLISFKAISTVMNAHGKGNTRYHSYKRMEGRAEGKSLLRNQKASLF